MCSPKVSVIIPTYRHCDFIRYTLDSVFNQNISDYEIIVINDGSPDETREVLAPLVSQGKIRYLEQENAGQAAARNHGIQLAKGTFVGFLDDDDLWPPDKLQWQTEFLCHNPDTGVVGGIFQAVDERGVPGVEGKFHPTITFDSLFVENPFFSPGQTLIRSDLLKQVGGMNVNIWGADDWDLWFRISKRSKIVMLNRLALYYRMHPGNSSKQFGRLLKGCCDTIELHVNDADLPQRRRLRAASYSTIYDGLATLVISQAKDEFGKGQIVTAARSLMGLLSLRRGLCYNKSLRRRLVQNLLCSPIKNRISRLRRFVSRSFCKILPTIFAPKSKAQTATDRRSNG